MVRMRDRMKGSSKIIASGVNQKGVNIDGVAGFWEGIVDEFQKRKYLTWGINNPARSADPSPYLPPEERIPCPFIFERLNIDSRGQVMVCGFDIAGVTNMGNIHEKSIRDLWHGEGFNRYRRMHLQRRGQELELCRDCPDWQYRSWRHNYWKLVKKAEHKRVDRLGGLDLQDAEGGVVESDE
jgi:radical SAM protein with 4Fe4S-binding SPASM domain